MRTIEDEIAGGLSDEIISALREAYESVDTGSIEGNKRNAERMLTDAIGKVVNNQQANPTRARFIGDDYIIGLYEAAEARTDRTPDRKAEAIAAGTALAEEPVFKAMKEMRAAFTTLECSENLTHYTRNALQSIATFHNRAYEDLQDTQAFQEYVRAANAVTGGKWRTYEDITIDHRYLTALDDFLLVEGRKRWV